MPLPSSQTVGASLDLGLGGQLSQQVQDETAEERRKRMQQIQQQQALAPGLASNTLFGGTGGIGF